MKDDSRKILNLGFDIFKILEEFQLIKICLLLVTSEIK